MCHGLDSRSQGDLLLLYVKICQHSVVWKIYDNCRFFQKGFLLTNIFICSCVSFISECNKVLLRSPFPPYHVSCLHYSEAQFFSLN